MDKTLFKLCSCAVSAEKVSENLGFVLSPREVMNIPFVQGYESSFINKTVTEKKFFTDLDYDFMQINTIKCKDYTEKISQTYYPHLSTFFPKDLSNIIQGYAEKPIFTLKISGLHGIDIKDFFVVNSNITNYKLKNVFLIPSVIYPCIEIHSDFYDFEISLTYYSISFKQEIFNYILDNRINMIKNPF